MKKNNHALGAESVGTPEAFHPGIFASRFSSWKKQHDSGKQGESAFLQNGLFSLFSDALPRFFPVLGNRDAAEGQENPRQGYPGQAFPQDDGGGHYGHDRNHVNVHAGFDGSQDFHHAVPGEEAQGGGKQAQVQQIEGVDGLHHQMPVHVHRKDEQGRNHQYDAVKEDAARADDHVGRVDADFFHQDGIDRPDEGRAQSQHVPRRVQFQHEGAVRHDEEDACEGGGEAQEEAAGEALPFQQEVGQKSREERHHGHDDAHIGGEGVRQGDVFQQEVQGDAGEARSREQEFLFPAGERKQARLQAPEESVPDHEAGEEHRDGGKVPEKHLGGHEGGPPDQDGHQGGGMAQRALAGVHRVVGSWGARAASSVRPTISAGSALLFQTA